jgi:hypothetical protein
VHTPGSWARTPAAGGGFFASTGFGSMNLVSTFPGRGLDRRGVRAAAGVAPIEAGRASPGATPS